MRFKVQHIQKPTRLDRVLKDQFPDWGRSAINEAIRSKQVAVNGKTVWLNSWKVRSGDQITLKTVPQTKTPPPQQFDPNWIIQDDGDIIAINKPEGLRSMATQWNKEGNLLDLARDYFGELHLFHRLDRDTSGVCLLTRGGQINQYLDTVFKQRKVQKVYKAWVQKPNQLQQMGIIDLPLDTDPTRRDKMIVGHKGGKKAVTQYELVRDLDKAQYVQLMPITGRTHQLRVHMQALGASILGDRLYSDAFQNYERLFLHAEKIILPATESQPHRDYSAPLAWSLPFADD